MACLCLALLLLLFVRDGSSSVCNGVVPPSFIKASDLSLQTLAKGAASKWCEDVDINAEVSNLGGRRESLINAFGRSNFVLEAAKKSKSLEDLIKKIFEEMSPKWFVVQAIPIVVGIVVLVCWLGWCWSGCPCCKFCRCCAKPARTHMAWKILLGLVLLGFFIVMVVAFVTMELGYAQTSQGVDRMACTGGRFIENVLDGVKDPPFVGFVPVLRQLDDIVDIFQKDSQFLKDTQAILDNTELLSDSIKVMTASLDMLSNMMKAPENQAPKLVGGVDSLHTCGLCKSLDGPIGGAVGVFAKGVATALENVKGQLQNFLKGDTFCKLETTLVDTLTPPLNKFKDLLARFLNPVLRGTYVEDAQFWVDDVGIWVVTSLGVFVVIYFILGLVASGCWLFREGRDLETNHPVYHRSAHRISCCVWWSLFALIVLLFLIGGAVQAATGPMSSMCLILDDLDSKSARDLEGLLQQDFRGDDAILLDMIDACVYTPFPPPKAPSNKNLLELIPGPSGQNMREFITELVTQPFEVAFSALDTAGQAANASSLSTDQGVLQLRAVLRNADLRSSILLDKAKAEAAGSGVQAMVRRSGLGEQSLITVSACEDLDVPQAVKDTYDFAKSLEKLPGVSSFVDLVTSSYGGQAGPATGKCQKSFTCDATSPDLQACAEAKHFVDNLKLPLMTEQVFSCDVWEDADGRECDILGMTLTDKDKGLYSNDCLIGTGKDKRLKTRTKKCTLDQFRQYVKDFDKRIELAVQRVDSASSLVFARIAQDLRSIVNRNLLVPFNFVSNGLSCGFMPVAYQKIVDSLCYQGVYGLRLVAISYLIFGISCMVLGLAMFCVWRRAVTNYNSMGGEPREGPSKKVGPDEESHDVHEENEVSTVLEVPVAASDTKRTASK